MEERALRYNNITKLSPEEYFKLNKKKPSDYKYSFDIVLEVPNEKIHVGDNLPMKLYTDASDGNISRNIEVITNYEEKKGTNSIKLSGVVLTLKPKKRFFFF